MGRSEDERWHLRKDGRKFYCSGEVSLLQGEGFQGFVKIARDLTQHMRLHEEQSQHLAETRQSSELKDEFFAVMSHELKHPLNLIQLNAHLAVRFGEQPCSSLISRQLLKTRVLTVASPAYLEKHGHPQHPTELEHPAHVCVDFRNPQTGKPFIWEFHRGAERLSVKTHGRLMVNDVGTLHRICEEGHGVAQVLELGIKAALRDGRLVQLFADWPDEYFPLYALYPSRHLPPAKVRAFLEFIVGVSRSLNFPS